MDDGKLIERAGMIARLAHAEQKRKDDKTDYIKHPEAVAKKTEEEGCPPHFVATALLHDVVEDSSVTLEDLRAFEIPEEVVDAVDAISRRKENSAKKEAYLTYLCRVGRNHMAKRVKIFDIEHNLSDSKPGSLKDKYTLAKFMLENFDFDDYSQEEGP